MTSWKKIKSSLKAAFGSFYKQPLGFPVGFQKTWQTIALVFLWTIGAFFLLLGRLLARIWRTVRR